MSATRFTTTAHSAAEATDKIPTDKAGVKGYNTPLTIGTYAQTAFKSTAAQARAGSSSAVNLTPANLLDIGVLSGLLYGLTLSNNSGDATNDLDIAAGSCIDSTNGEFMTLAALTKRLDANWAAGTNQGMRNSAEAIDNDTYHIFAVCKAGGADADIYAHEDPSEATALTALQAETGGSAYAFARRIGSILRIGATIIGFSQMGDEFLIKDPILDVDASGTLTTAEMLSTLSVPTGIKVHALINAMTFDASSGHAVYISSPDVNDEAPSFTAGPGRTINGAANLVHTETVKVRTSTSAQIRSRSDLATVDTYRVTTLGWIDTRGRLGP
jgi:hypothetical protein